MFCVGNGSIEVAYRAQQLLEHSLLSELRAVVARALSGLDMFAGGQLSELDLLGSDLLENAERDVRTPRCCSALHGWQCLRLHRVVRPGTTVCGASLYVKA